MKIFFIDIDNTLMYKGVMPQENIAEIKRARENGNIIVLNTGRSYEYIPWDVIKGAEYDGVISGLGSYILFRDKTIYSNPLSHEKCVQLVDMFAEINKWIKLEGERVTFFQNRTDNTHLTIKSSEDFLRVCGNEKISKFTCERLSEKETEILSHEYEIYNYDTYSEGSVRGTSKKAAIGILLEYLGKTKEDCVALGDSINDLGMFEMCAQSAAMGNAVDEIKSLCTYTACHAANGGVADAIRHFTRK